MVSQEKGDTCFYIRKTKCTQEKNKKHNDLLC
jgi:hypothetical protein